MQTDANLSVSSTQKSENSIFISQLKLQTNETFFIDEWRFLMKNVNKLQIHYKLELFMRNNYNMQITTC